MQNDTTRQAAARRFSFGLAALVAVLSGTVLAGWALGLPGHYTLLPYGEHIRPWGAVCILALSLSLCVSRGEDRPAGRILARVMGGFVLVIASLNIAELGLGLDFGLDHVLFPLVLQKLSVPNPGRLTLYAALSFFLSAAALILFSHKGTRAGFVAQAAAITSLGLVAVVLGGYLFGAPHIMTPETMLPMPAGAALLAVLLNLGLLTAHPEQGPFGLSLESGPGSAMLRRFLPLMVVAPFFIGIASMLIFSDFLQHDRTMISSAVISISFFFSFLLFYIARAVNRFHVELQKSEVRTRTVADYTYDWEYWRAPDGHVVWVSPSCERISGYSVEEFMEDRGLFRRIVHPEDARFMDAHIEKIDTGDIHPCDMEMRIVKRSGEIVWIHHCCVNIAKPDGTSLGRRACNRDISKRKKAEEALRENEEQFELFMKHCPIYVFFKDENIRPIRLSKNFEGMFGRPLNELLGKSMYDLFPLEQAEMIINDEMKVLRDGVVVTAEESFGGKIYTTMKFPINRAGKPPFLAGFIIDITERKRAEELQGEIERIVQHDLRSPAGSAVTLARLLSQSPSLGEEERYLAALLERSGQRMLDILNLSLDLYKIETGRYQLDPKDLDLGTLTHENAALLLLLPQHASNRIEFFVNGLPEDDAFSCFCKGDPFLMRMAFQNLLLNALEASPSNGVVVVDLARNGGCKLEIRNKSAAPVDIRARFFEKYVTKGKHKGVGIGTYCAKKVIEVQGGSIEMRTSDEEDETVITIHMPG